MKLSIFGAKFLGAAACAVIAGSASAAALTPGNLVALKVGDGVAALSAAGTTVTVQEYTPAGVLVQNISVPTTGPNACVVAGNGSVHALLHTSSDGNYLLFGGYVCDAGTAAPKASTIPRSIARLTVATGALDTSTQIAANTATGNDIRAVGSVNGTSFWVSTADRGVVYLSSFGTSQPGVNIIDAPSTNTRDLVIFNGQLYMNTGSATPGTKIFTVGTGLPTTPSQVITAFPGMPTGAGPYQFAFDTTSRVFVGDITLNPGLQEWTESAGTWTRVSTNNPGGTLSSMGVAVGSTEVFASTQAGIWKTSKAAPGALTSIVTSAANTAFRGLAVVPGAPAKVGEWRDFSAND